MSEDHHLRWEVMTAWLRVRDKSGAVVPLRPNIVQAAFDTACGPRNIVLKARQMGITTWIAARFFLHTITLPGTLTVLVAQDRDAAEGIFRIVQRIWENLPASFRLHALQRGRANVGQMTFPHLDSEFRVLSAADPNAGRGLSIQKLHCSEVAHWPGNAAATLAGLRAALVPHGEMVLESTPNGAVGAFYDEWQSAVDAGSTTDASTMVVRHFFPWWMEPGYTRSGAPLGALSEHEEALVLRHGLNDGQLRFRRELERGFGALRSQEYAEDAETCFRASGECCFDVGSIEARRSELEAPPAVQRNGALHVWLPPVATRRYVVAVDTAGGGSDGDYAAVQVVDLASGMQCAELQQKLPPLELASVCAGLARTYNNALLAVERNNHGGAVLAYVATVERYTTVYGQNGVEGWLTTSLSKPAAIARIGALLVEQPQLFRSRRLLGECRTYLRNARGQTNAAAGQHDDLLMAMAIAQAVRVEVLQTRK